MFSDPPPPSEGTYLMNDPFVSKFVLITQSTKNSRLVEYVKSRNQVMEQMCCSLSQRISNAHTFVDLTLPRTT